MKTIIQLLFLLNTFCIIGQDGHLDTTFNPTVNLNTSVYAIAEQADGKILIGGDNFIIRLNANGTSDSSFNNVANFSGVVAATYLPAGKSSIKNGSKSSVVGSSSTLTLSILNALVSSRCAWRTNALEGNNQTTCFPFANVRAVRSSPIIDFPEPVGRITNKSRSI